MKVEEKLYLEIWYVGRRRAIDEGGSVYVFEACMSLRFLR